MTNKITQDKWNGPSQQSVVYGDHFTEDSFEFGKVFKSQLALLKRRRLALALALALAPSPSPSPSPKPGTIPTLYKPRNKSLGISHLNGQPLVIILECLHIN